jgi:hypothetical protein
MTPESTRPSRPIIIVTFAGEDSATAIVEAPGVTAGQLAVAAFLIAELARDVRSGELTRAILGSLDGDRSAALAALVGTALDGAMATSG